MENAISIKFSFQIRAIFGIARKTLPTHTVFHRLLAIDTGGKSIKHSTVFSFEMNRLSFYNNFPSAMKWKIHYCLVFVLENSKVLHMSEFKFKIQRIVCNEWNIQTPKDERKILWKKIKSE